MGSGSTGHAIFELNKKFGSHRKFILIDIMDYAETVAAERIRRAISGYPFKGKKEEEIYSKKLTAKNLSKAEEFLKEAEAISAEKASEYAKISKPKIADNSLKVIGTKVYDDQMEGLGGAFDYYELGAPLFKEDGNLNEEVGIDKIREYIYYSETKFPLLRATDESEPYLLDEFNRTGYYFYYKTDELKGIDLMSRNCPVRYIITINALKEGWDCPFAYILASTANRSSKIDVEQILGRILRQPYTRQHGNVLLNMSYVLTSSANFNTTIDNVVESLRLSGYSRKDYVATNASSDNFMQPESRLNFRNDEALRLTYASRPEESEPSEWEFNSDDIILPTTDNKGNASDDKGISLENATTILIKEAENMSQQYEQDIQKSLNNKTSEEVMQKTKTYAIQDRYKPFVECIKLPKFCIKVSKNYGVFGITKDFVPLTQETLLEDFKLSKEDKRIDFSYNNTNIKKIDIDQNDEDNIITTSMKEKEAMALDNFYGNINDKDRLIFLLAQSIRKNITRDNSISDADLNKYITSVLEEQELSQLRNLGRNSSNTTQAFKNKIRQLKIAFAEEQFNKKVQSKQIEIVQQECLPSEIILTKDKAPALDKKMYIEEEGFNEFEREVIEQVISLDCVRCWHRNQEKGKGFCINGFVNAYPDFIILLNNGVTVLLETKGSYLDGSDSKNKTRCGNKWADKAGSKFAYFMVFEDKPIAGAFSVGDFLERLKELGEN